MLALINLNFATRCATLVQIEIDKGKPFSNSMLLEALQKANQKQPDPTQWLEQAIRQEGMRQGYTLDSDDAEDILQTMRQGETLTEAVRDYLEANEA